MSHHFTAPDSGFPHGDARLDLTDLFAFPKPGDSSKSIPIMDVHPSVGENPQGPTTTEPFAPEALYELKIDTEGDAVADIAYRVRFSSYEGGQTATLRRVEGMQAAGIGEEGAPCGIAASSPPGASYRSRPSLLPQTGRPERPAVHADFFADKDVCSIVVEVPNSALRSDAVGLWHRTLVPADGLGEGWAQVERGARPLSMPFGWPASVR